MKWLKNNVVQQIMGVIFCFFFLMSQSDTTFCMPAAVEKWREWEPGGDVSAWFIDDDNDCISTDWEIEYLHSDGEVKIYNPENWAPRNGGDPSFDFSQSNFNCCSLFAGSGGSSPSGISPYVDFK